MKILFGLFLLIFSLNSFPQGVPSLETRPDDIIYQEMYRPQFHYSPPFGWMNDPNGMVFYKGEYHLFFQYNPYAVDFGRIGWGHAVSNDLVSWRQLPVAIPPDNNAEIFTGSVVIDAKNTSGFCTSTDPNDPSCLVAIYTTNRPLSGGGFNQTQDLAYSNDQGRTWVKYPGNPVLDLGDPNFRDPKVFYYGPEKKWIMAIVLPENNKVVFYESPNLKNWNRAGEFGPAGEAGGDWECPDLLQIPVDGSEENSRWVLKVDVKTHDVVGGAGAQYFVGNFNGETFVSDNPQGEILWADYGKDFYCAHRFYDAPDALGDPIWIGWMNDWLYADELPTYPWLGNMSLPRSLGLQSTPEGLKLTQTPVDSMSVLRGIESNFESSNVEAINTQVNSANLNADIFEVLITLRPGSATEAGVRLRQGPANGAPTGEVTATIGYDVGNEQLFIDRPSSGNAQVSGLFPGTHAGPLEMNNGEVTIRIFLDRSSVEAFGNNGEIVITDLLFPKDTTQPTRLKFYSKGGNMELMRIKFWPLESIWDFQGEN